MDSLLNQIQLTDNRTTPGADGETSMVSFTHSQVTCHEDRYGPDSPCLTRCAAATGRL